MEDHSLEFQLFPSIFSQFMAFPRCVPNVHHFVASKPVLVWFSDEAHFCFPGTSIAKTMFFGVRRFQTKFFRGRFIPLNVLPGWPWASTGSSGLFGSKMMTADIRQSTRSATRSLFWTSTGRRWDAGEGLWELHNGFSTTGHTSYSQRNHCLVEAEVRRETHKQKM